jgi:hypothetical protein
MIDLTDEKKSLGVISVTRVTDSLHLPGSARRSAPTFAQVRNRDVMAASDRPVSVGLVAPVKKT